MGTVDDGHKSTALRLADMQREFVMAQQRRRNRATRAPWLPDGADAPPPAGQPQSHAVRPPLANRGWTGGSKT